MIARIGHLLALGAVAIVIAVWLAVLRPQTLGGPAMYVAIQGSSMLPGYSTGDLLVVRPAEQYEIGDVVAYRVPPREVGEGEIVVHRIVGGDESNGFVMQGDNNPASDPWTPRATDMVGRAWVHVPGLGGLISFLHQPMSLAALGAALAVMFVLAREPRPEAPRRKVAAQATK